ncbi:MAG TPA: hypothetical protein VK927_11795 [Adhaeribacter sp.]|nr:hypothetical protein [Adhaeribacter sp.]
MKNCISFTRIYILAAVLLVSGTAFAQKPGTIGLGIKAGDPTGLSAKFYQSSFDIELVVGRPYYFSSRYRSNSYYNTRFYKIDKFSNKYYKFGYYESANPLAIQVHFLKTKATKTAKELKWYYGGGPQLRAHRVEYFYYDDRYKNVYYSEVVTNIDLGLDGVVGLEYTFSDIPISIFADVNLFVEILDEPLHLGLQGGLGVRYNL